MDGRRSMTANAGHASRRFTTLEGWREVGSGIYSLRRASVRMITIEPQFDLERWHDHNMPTRSATPDVGDHRRLSSKTGGRTSAELANAQDPFDDAFALEESDRDEEKRDQVRSSRDVQSENGQSQKPGEEKLYHVFSQRQKWLLIVIIGVAGMFSGLSSNIYFPSLNTIARASHLMVHNCSFKNVHGLTDSIIGSSGQSRRRLVDRHVVPHHPRRGTNNMGLAVRRAWPKAYLSCLLYGLHHRQYCSELLPQFCSIASFQGPAGSR